MIEKEFVPYEEALALKELGFNEPCCKYIYIGDTGINVDHYLEVEPSKARNYNEDSLCISQPTFSQAFRWFRERFNLHHEIEYNGFEYLGYVSGMTANIFKTYEEAELACLRRLIEMVK